MNGRTVCKFCGRPIVMFRGEWIDPEASGDDTVWRATCDENRTFTAEHAPDARLDGKGGV